MFIRMTLKQFTEAFLESKLSKKDKVELIKANTGFRIF